MVPLQERVRRVAQACLERAGCRDTRDACGEGARVVLHQRLVAGVDRKPRRALGCRHDRDAVTEPLEQLEPHAASVEDRRHQRGRALVDRREVRHEPDRGHARRLPARRDGWRAALARLQAGADKVEGRLGHPRAHVRPDLAEEPVESAHVRAPRERPDVAEPRRGNGRRPSAYERHDLRDESRVDSREVAVGARVVGRDGGDRVDAA